MSHRSENEPSRNRPVNKATMDQPQEEFIQPGASVVDPEEEPGTVLEDTVPPIRQEEQSRSAD